MDTTAIPLNVPAGSHVINFLYPNMEVDDLSEDMVCVVLPNGIIIDAGWFPPADEDGRFIVRASADGKEFVCIEHFDEILKTPITDPYDVAEIVSQLADAYGADDWSAVACSDFTEYLANGPVVV